MIRIDVIWLALGASDLRGGIDKLLALVVHGFASGAQAHHAYVFANHRADRLKVLVYDGAGMCCAHGACRPQASPGRARTRARCTSRWSDALDSTPLSARMSIGEYPVSRAREGYFWPCSKVRIRTHSIHRPQTMRCRGCAI